MFVFDLLVVIDVIKSEGFFLIMIILYIIFLLICLFLKKFSLFIDKFFNIG